MQNIGFPSNVRHVNHVGWDPEKGFKVYIVAVTVDWCIYLTLGTMNKLISTYL